MIEECPTEYLNERERFWIAYYNSQEYGYNSTRGGQNDPYYTDIDKAVEYYLHHKDEKTLTEITKDLRIQPNRLRDLLEELGLRNKQAYTSYSEISQQEKDSICREYSQGITITDLTKKYHHDFDTIKNILKERNLYASRSKSVLQYTIDGTLVKEWPTLAAAVKEYNNRHIGECARGKRKTAAGYKWKYTHGADNLDSIGD